MNWVERAFVLWNKVLKSEFFLKCTGFEDVILSEGGFWRAKQFTRYVLACWITFTNILFMKWICKGLAKISTISSTVDHYRHVRINKGELARQSHSIVLFWTPCYEQQLGNYTIIPNIYVLWYEHSGFEQVIHILYGLSSWHPFATSIGTFYARL